MGFAESARGLWELIEPWLEGAAAGRTRLVVCGHSLGAAIATLLAAPAGAELLLTIGSPRVGNAEFVAGLQATPGLRITRIVNCSDAVTRVPPSLLGFEHAGAPTYVDRHGGVHADPPQALIDSDSEAASLDFLAHVALRDGALAARELADHAPINYIRAFWP
jgi:pimeloyl-ACP methyl ester carboxylesterase